jgi:hypothetical protein
MIWQENYPVYWTYNDVSASPLQYKGLFVLQLVRPKVIFTDSAQSTFTLYKARYPVPLHRHTRNVTWHKIIVYILFHIQTLLSSAKLNL